MKKIFVLLFTLIFSCDDILPQIHGNDICLEDSLHNMAYNFFSINRDDVNAIRLEKYVYHLLTSKQPIDSAKYYKCIKALAEYYSDSEGDYSILAIKLYREALDYCKTHYGNKTIEYYTMQSQLGYILLDKDLDEGAQLITLALQNIDKNNYPKEYALTMINYSWYLFYKDKVHESRKYAIEAADILRSYIDTEEYTYALHQIAYYSLLLGDFEFAIPFVKECVKRRELLFGTCHRYYINSLNLLGCLYKEIGEFGKSISVVKQVLVKYERLYGKENLDYSCSLNNLCDIYTSIGDFKQALPLAIEALSIDLKLSEKGEYDRLDVSYNNVAYCYNKLGLVDSTLYYSQKAIDISISKYGYMSRELIVPYNNMSNYLVEANKTDKARSFANKSLDICMVDSMSNKRLLIYTINLLGIISKKDGNIIGAIRLFEEARTLCKANPIAGYDIYNEIIKNLIQSYFDSSNYEAAEYYLEEYISYVRSSILKDFLSVPPNKRNLFWKTHEEMLCNDIIRYASKINNEKISRIAYDACLISKSLLLSTEQSFKAIAEKSGDSETIRLVSKLEKLCLDYNELSIQENNQTEDICKNIEEEIIYNYEELLKRSNIFSDIQKQYKVISDDVVACLQDSALSIEFARYKDSNDFILVAIVCDSKGSFTTIPICEESKFEKYCADNQMHDWIYCTIWNPILSKYKDYKYIYFSPIGNLYSISIENIKLNHDEMIGDKYIIYRLSSTREIVLKKTPKIISKAAIYGGLEYDATEELISLSNSRYLYSQSLWGVAKRKYLKGTQLELSSIIKNISAYKKIELLTYSGAMGTENSFKNLSNSNVNLLHIATHGFYTPIWKSDMASNLLKTESNSDALLRSGLLFSGVNKYLNEDGLFSAHENEGVLTSQEISELDFSMTDLVVLSACESGLGDITNDGVWGLQRGFKKAGVNGIIMSLWEVDDMATSLLMSQFYHNFLNGKSKRDALMSAQKYVMNYSKEYSNPYYWASFVLLDGYN